jgi:hypothetical protein
MHIENVYERGITCLDENQQKSYKDLLVEFQTIFSKSEDDIGLTNLVEHTINTGDHRPSSFMSIFLSHRKLIVS